MASPSGPGFLDSISLAFLSEADRKLPRIFRKGNGSEGEYYPGVFLIQRCNPSVRPESREKSGVSSGGMLKIGSRPCSFHQALRFWRLSLPFLGPRWRERAKVGQGSWHLT